VAEAAAAVFDACDAAAATTAARCACANAFNCFYAPHAKCGGEVQAEVEQALTGEVCQLYGACLLTPDPTPSPTSAPTVLSRHMLV
jgi:hypothetical protein